MATGKKNKKKTKVKKNSESLREINHLRTLLKYTERSIRGDSEALDDLFIGQADKIQDKIDKLEGKQ